VGRHLLSTPGVADLYTILMNLWNTPPESYQQRVYKMTLATVKRPTQQAESSTAAVVISMEAARVENGIPLGYLTSDVALEEPEIGCTHLIILIDNHRTDDELPCWIPVGSGDYDDKGHETNEHDAIPTATWGHPAATELERFHLGTSDVDGYEGDDGDEADEDEDEEASHADDASTQNLEDWVYSTRECEDWTVYIQLVKYDSGEANATANDVSEAKNVL